MSLFFLSQIMHTIWALCLLFLIVGVSVAPPVDPSKKDKGEKTEELDDFGLEYGRYLQQVVQALEEDKEFAKKLENISAEQIRSGHIAKELEFVKHNVRSKLDELKRIEVDRLRKLVQEQMERSELGLNRKGVKIPHHVDINNPHSFEISDLKKLIQSATSDLEALDKQRRDEFKKYELDKEATYRESLKNLTVEERKETEKHHDELVQKHKDHPKIHHPGSKPQLEQVWEDQDNMPKEEFNPKTFFAMHDVNGDGHLDVEEVEAILIPEVKKMYNPNNEEDDPAEMEEEFHRMREHIFNETDKNKDSLISLEEFLKMTEKQDFQEDEGWKGLDEQSVYSEAELEEYMRQKQMEMQYGDQRMYYDVPHAQQQGLPPHINYQAPPQPGYPQQGYPQGSPQQYQGHPQQGHPQQPQFQGQQGHPQQPPQFQGHPQQQQQFQGHPQQQQFQGQQGHPQQQQFQGQQGHPQQQQFQGQQGHPQQQQFQGQQGHPQQQQQFQGHPPQQQFQGQQGHPPQQPFQGHPQQPQFQGQAQQPQFQGQPQQPQIQGTKEPAPKQEVSGQAVEPQPKPSGTVNQVPNVEVKPNVP